MLNQQLQDYFQMVTCSLTLRLQIRISSKNTNTKRLNNGLETYSLKLGTLPACQTIQMALQQTHNTQHEFELLLFQYQLPPLLSSDTLSADLTQKKYKHPPTHLIADLLPEYGIHPYCRFFYSTVINIEPPIFVLLLNQEY